MTLLERIRAKLQWWQVGIAGPTLGRRQLILEVARNLDAIAKECAEKDGALIGGCERDAYRDMAAALRLLADERGT